MTRRHNKNSISTDQLSFVGRQVITVESFLRCSTNDADLLKALVMEGLQASHRKRIEAVKIYAMIWDCSFVEAWRRILSGDVNHVVSETSYKQLFALIRRADNTNVPACFDLL